MTTSALIDLVLNVTDNVASSDADNATRRLRILQYAQEVCEEIRNAQDWGFKYLDYSLTGTAGNNFILVPTTNPVLELGDHGNLYRGTTKMHEVSLGHLFRARQTGMSTYPLTDIFCFGQLDEANADVDDSIQEIRLAVTLSANTDYSLYAVRAPYVLTDATTAANNLQYNIPSPFHNTVVLAGVIARVKREKGEQGNYWDIYQKGITDMAARLRQRKTVANRMPRAVSSW